MFERFTSPARAALVSSNNEAKAFEQASIGSDHLLLGVSRAPNALAPDVLQSLGLTVSDVRQAIAAGRSADAPRHRCEGQRGPGQLALSDEAQGAVGRAFTELEHTMDYRIGTGHLLLGLASQKAGAAHRILINLGVDVDQLGEQLTEVLRANPDDTPTLTEIERTVERHVPLSAQAKAEFWEAFWLAQNAGTGSEAPENVALVERGGLALEQLLMDGRPLVLTVARAYARRYGRDTRLAYRVGGQGLGDAIFGWGSHRAQPFDEYATSAIRHAIHRALGPPETAP